MKVLVDMNLSPRWVDLLGRAGFDAVHWIDVGPTNAPDAELMSFAHANDYVVLTHDLDFGAILAAGRANKPSVVQVRGEDVRPESIGEQVVTALALCSSQLQEGALLTIDAAKCRVRVLPFSL